MKGGVLVEWIIEVASGVLALGLIIISMFVLIFGPIYAMMNGFSCDVSGNGALIKKILIKSGNTLLMIFAVLGILASIGLNWTSLVFAVEQANAELQSMNTNK